MLLIVTYISYDCAIIYYPQELDMVSDGMLPEKEEAHNRLRYHDHTSVSGSPLPFPDVLLKGLKIEKSSLCDATRSESSIPVFHLVIYIF